MNPDKKELAVTKKKLSTGDTISIERDYSKGIGVCFETALPDPLKDLVHLKDSLTF